MTSAVNQQYSSGAYYFFRFLTPSPGISHVLNLNALETRKSSPNFILEQSTRLEHQQEKGEEARAAVRGRWGTGEPCRGHSLWMDFRGAFSGLEKDLMYSLIIPKRKLEFGQYYQFVPDRVHF